MEIERIRVVLVDLPANIRGATTRSYEDGEEFYTIWLNSRLDHAALCRAYDHEIRHIEARDFDHIIDDVQRLEVRSHA